MTIDRSIEEPCEVTSLTHGFEAERRGRPLRLGNPYSKRALARDQVEVMRQLGFERFFVAGHDRGGYCAVRMALDAPERVLKLAVFDNIPIGEAFRRTTREFALGWWHWFFFAQPDVPERLILENPDNFYRWGERMRAELPAYFAAEAVEDYRRCVYNPETIRAMIEEYRAGATYDFALDEADRGKKRISCPMLVLTCLKDDLKDYFDIEGIWREWATHVRFERLDAGHYAADLISDNENRRARVIRTPARL